MNEFFDKIFLINLNRRSDRMVECVKIMDKLGIKYERIEAVDGKELETNLPNNSTFDRKNDLGCTLSHLKVMNRIKDEKLKSALILEDDFEPCENFLTKFYSYKKQLPNDWQWLYFGGSHEEPPIKVTENIYRGQRINTTHAYAVKFEIVDNLIEALEDDFTTSVDIRLSKYHKDLKTYVFVPHLIYQREGYSDIQQKNVDYMGIKNFKG